MTLAEGAGLLAELSDALRDMQMATAKAVDLAGKVQRANVVEIIEGLPLELLLALEHRLVSSDARMLLEAARLLAHMPVTKTLFVEGTLSWGQIRGMVARLRRMQVSDLGMVDERVEASLDLVDKYSPDELIWAVERAADDIDGPRRVERREQRTVEASFLAVQPSFDGCVRCMASWTRWQGRPASAHWRRPADFPTASQPKLGRPPVGRSSAPRP